jgi:hypothetical protein
MPNNGGIIERFLIPHNHMTSRPLVVLSVCLAALMTAAACKKKQPDLPPVATPTVTFSSSRIPLGSPVEVTYRFQVAPGATFQENYRVFVHFLDSDDELMWADDHDPPVPTSTWKPGQVIEYKRTMFAPIYRYVGQASVHLGLYSTKTQKRLPLGGESSGLLEYKVASIQLLPHSENVFLLFKDGWHPAETAGNNSAVEWQWTKRSATITFRNPKKPSIFFLHADNPGSYAAEQTVTLKVNGQQVETIPVAPQQEIVHKTPLTLAQLGSGDMVEVTLDMNKTWIPAQIAGSGSHDYRELGLRVFHAFVEPQS